MKNKNKVLVSISAFALIACSFSVSTYLQSKKDWVVSESAKKIKNPVKTSDESVKSGKALYAKHCKSCHGAGGKGDGSKSKELDTPCGDFTSSDFQEQSDGSIFYKINEGRKDMPSFKKKITDVEDIWAIVNYARTFDRGGNKEKPKVIVEEKKDPKEEAIKKTKDAEVKKDEKKTLVEKKDKAVVAADSISKHEKTSIALVLKHFEEALNASDSLKIMTVFDTNAIFMPKQKITVGGAIQINDYYKQLFKTNQLNLMISVEAIELSNGFAFVRGNLIGELIFIIDNHKAPEENSLFMVMKKTKGEWKIYYCMYN